MARYFFDLQDDDGTSVDEEGLEFSSLRRVQEEAACSLVDVARDAGMSRDSNIMRNLAVTVRNESGMTVLQVRMNFEVDVPGR
jgi:hypothetical protein